MQCTFDFAFLLLTGFWMFTYSMETKAGFHQHNSYTRLKKCRYDRIKNGRTALLAIGKILRMSQTFVEGYEVYWCLNPSKLQKFPSVTRTNYSIINFDNLWSQTYKVSLIK